MEGIRIEARSQIESVVIWLDQLVPDWRLSVDDDHSVVACRPTGGMRFRPDAVVVDVELRIELREVQWRNTRLRVPRWVRLERGTALPALPAGARLSEALRPGRWRRFRLALTELTQAIDLARLRQALSGGGMSSLG